MPWTTLALSMAAAMSLPLAAMHLRAWVHNPRARESLLFTVAALAAVATALLEASLLHSQTAADYGERLRWLHLPVAIITISLAWFIPLYFRAGRAWLAWLITAMRGTVVAVNFTSPVNATFTEITGLEPITFLGETLATPIGVPSPWRALATLSALLLLAHAVDAGLAARKLGTRPRPLLLAGVIAYVIVQTAILSRLMVEGLLPAPFIGLGFVLIVLVMFYELSSDLVRSSRYAHDLARSERRMDLAAGAADLLLWEWDVGANQVSLVGGSHGPSEPPIQTGDTFEKFLESLHPDDRDAIRDAVGRAIAGEGELRTHYRWFADHGETRWVSLQGSVERDAQGRALLVRGASRDITDRKLAEMELEARRGELVHVQRVLTLEQLSSSLAHELSQPLGAILRNAEAADLLIRNDSVDLEELRAIVGDLLDDDRRALGIIDRLRDLLKQHTLPVQALPIEPLVMDVVAIVRSELATRGIDLRMSFEAGLPHAMVNRVQVQQVLLNLVLNAADAVRDEAGARRLIEVRVTHEGVAGLEVAVTDRGSGIPPNKLDHLFEPFFSSKREGIGLGLSISRTIVESHGGRIWAEPNPDGGAVFRFTLPAAPSGGGA